MPKEASLLDRIRSLQSTINKRTQDKSRLEGQRDELLKRLKSEFKCDSVGAAEARAEELREQIAATDDELAGVERRLGELQKQMEA